MGMFDTIAWGDDLPYTLPMEEIGLNKRDWDFQTKDLDCAMQHYVVQGGKLYLQKFKHEEWVAGDPKAKSLMDRIGYLDRQEPYLDPVKLTTTIQMYDFRHSVDDRWDCWIEYEVIFDEGNVKSVNLIKFTKESDFVRKEQERQWREEREREAARWVNRFFFYTKPYRFVARNLRRGLYALAEFTHKIANKL